MAEENQTINLVVDGEARQYKLDALSDAARQKNSSVAVCW